LNGCSRPHIGSNLLDHLFRKAVADTEHDAPRKGTIEPTNGQPQAAPRIRLELGILDRSRAADTRRSGNRFLRLGSEELFTIVGQAAGPIISGCGGLTGNNMFDYPAVAVTAADAMSPLRLFEDNKILGWPATLPFKVPLKPKHLAIGGGFQEERRDLSGVGLNIGDCHVRTTDRRRPGCTQEITLYSRKARDAWNN
jgi:hypothetical protein